MKSLSRDFEGRRLRTVRNLLNLRAGDGDRTRDVHLGKIRSIENKEQPRLRCSFYQKTPNFEHLALAELRMDTYQAAEKSNFSAAC